MLPIVLRKCKRNRRSNIEDNRNPSKNNPLQISIQIYSHQIRNKSKNKNKEIIIAIAQA